MEIKTELNPMFSYSPIPAIIFGILLLLLLGIMNRKKKKKEVKKENLTSISNKEKDTKEKYIKKLEKLDNDLKMKKIKEKEAYQNLSKLIRNFMYETKNIKVQYYTLKEIEKLNIPMLEELIKECYDNEFKKETTGNINNTIEKTRKVIEKWN